jgi:hypothetical protein
MLSLITKIKLEQMTYEAIFSTRAHALGKKSSDFFITQHHSITLKRLGTQKDMSYPV